MIQPVKFGINLAERLPDALISCRKALVLKVKGAQLGWVLEKAQVLTSPALRRKKSPFALLLRASVSVRQLAHTIASVLTKVLSAFAERAIKTASVL